MESLKPYMQLIQFVNNEGGTSNPNAQGKQRLLKNYKDSSTKPFIQDDMQGGERSK